MSTSTVPIRPASTVVMLRRAQTEKETEDVSFRQEQFEVFMVRRNPRSEFVGGAFVFPGGAIDPSDWEVAPSAFNLSDQEASRLLGLETGGLAWYAAAVRELYEEAGVLLAVVPSGDFIDPSTDPDLAESLKRWRRRLNDKKATFAEVLEALGVIIDVTKLHFFSHWVTPPGQPRRYDTRFFLCEMPARQRPDHDGGETTESLWISPKAAFEAATRGRITLIFPTLKNLELLASIGSLEETLRWARERSPEAVKPRISIQEGTMRILVPGDKGYEEAGELE